MLSETNPHRPVLCRLTELRGEIWTVASIRPIAELVSRAPDDEGWTVCIAINVVNHRTARIRTDDSLSTRASLSDLGF